jgi:hypothetical protein
MKSRRLMGLTPRPGSRTNYSTMHRSKKQLLMSALGHSRLIDMLETPL